MLLRLRTRLLSGAVVSAAVWSLGAETVHAFDDLYRFNDPAIQGGGGGRWFTGSPADNYTCQVCHEDREAQQIVVAGLPERYTPGLSYDISISWPASYPQVTALVEITDQTGSGAGDANVSASPASVAESCEPADSGIAAAVVLSGPELAVADGRQLVGMQDCGGTVLRWRWTAPASDIGPVLFAGGLVVGDEHMDAHGDRVAKLSKWIASPSRANTATRIRGSCSSAGVLGTRTTTTRAWLAFVVTTWLARRHSATRSRRRSHDRDLRRRA